MVCNCKISLLRHIHGFVLMIMILFLIITKCDRRKQSTQRVLINFWRIRYRAQKKSKVSEVKWNFKFINYYYTSIYFIFSLAKRGNFYSTNGVAVLCPKFKKEDRFTSKYYRGVALLYTTYKLLSYLILARLKLSLRLSKYYKTSLGVHLVFWNFKQTFNSIRHRELLQSGSRICRLSVCLKCVATERGK